MREEELKQSNVTFPPLKPKENEACVGMALVVGWRRSGCRRRDKARPSLIMRSDSMVGDWGLGQETELKILDMLLRFSVLTLACSRRSMQ